MQCTWCCLYRRAAVLGCTSSAAVQGFAVPGATFQPACHFSGGGAAGAGHVEHPGAPNWGGCARRSASRASRPRRGIGRAPSAAWARRRACACWRTWRARARSSCAAPRPWSWCALASRRGVGGGADAHALRLVSRNRAARSRLRGRRGAGCGGGAELPSSDCACAAATGAAAAGGPRVRRRDPGRLGRAAAGGARQVWRAARAAAGVPGGLSHRPVRQGPRACGPARTPEVSTCSAVCQAKACHAPTD